MKSLFAMITLFVINSYASPYGKRPDRWSFELRSEFLESTENLDTGGDVVDLSTNGSFEENKISLQTEYDYSKRLTLLSNLVFNSVTANDNNFERSNSNLNDVHLGLEYTIYRGRFWFMPSFDIKFPLHTYSISSDEALGNDTSIDLTAKANFSSKWGRLFAHAYFGLTYRTEGLSSLLPLGFEAKLYLGKISIAGGIRSFYSITDDDDTDNETARDNFLTTVNAGSKRYFSVNPNQTSTYIHINYFIEPQFYFGLGATQTLFGENSYYGTTFVANLGLSFGGERAKRLPKLKPTRFKKKRNKKRFELQFQQEEDKDTDVFNNNDIQYKEAPPDSLDNLEESLEIQLKRKKK